MNSRERRRSPRAPWRTQALLHCGPAPLGSFEVVNLAAGGLLLAGPAPAPPGTVLQVGLALGAGEPLQLPGQILRERSGPQGPGFVVVFGPLSPSCAAHIGARIEQNLAEMRNAHVLVVDDSRAAGHELRLRLAQLGHPAHAVTSPLEAVRLLAEPNRIGVAMVHQQLGSEDGLELLGHLAERHPYLRRVLLADPLGQRQLGAVLRQRPHAAPHEVLAPPWTDSTLARAVGGL